MSIAKQLRPKLRRATHFAIALATVWLATSGLLIAHAFTLIPAPSLVVGPATGTPTATFAVQGSMGPGLPCTSPANFAFYWDATVNLLAYKTVPTCATPGTYDTGTIGGLRPAAGYDTVGPHTVILTVTDSAGNPYGPVSTVTKSYTITAPPPPPPPPSPSPQPPPPPPPPAPSPSTAPASPSTQPAPSPSASPSQKQCPATGAALAPSGPAGKDGAVILGFVLVGALPIGGVVLVFTPGLWSGHTRWRKIASLLGLAVVLTAAGSCAFPTCTAPAATSQTASPPASPTPTC